MPTLYYPIYRYYFDAVSELGRKNTDVKIDDIWDVPLTAMFLTLDDPRPTIEELRLVLCPPGSEIVLDSQNQRRRRGWVPDPDKPGWMKYDPKEFTKVLDSDRQKILSAMEEIVIRQKGPDWRIKAEQKMKSSKTNATIN